MVPVPKVAQDHIVERGGTLCFTEMLEETAEELQTTAGTGTHLSIPVMSPRDVPVEQVV